MPTFPRFFVVDVARIVAVGGFAFLIAGGLGCGGSESPGGSGKGGSSATGTAAGRPGPPARQASPVARARARPVRAVPLPGDTTRQRRHGGDRARHRRRDRRHFGGRRGGTGGGSRRNFRRRLRRRCPRRVVRRRQRRWRREHAGSAGDERGSGGSGAVGGGGGAGRGGAGGGGGATGGGGAAGANDGSGPPMGWASWNTFAAKINYNVIKQQADAMVSSGLKAAGYQYVNIDEGWWQGTRDGSGNITVDTADWPGGMQAIADYIHGMGLKAGIYTDAGKDGCGYYYPTGRPAAPGSGSEGHYDQDFLQFSKWGFDFVKVDWCGGNAEGLDPQTAYQAISDSIKKATAQTGRPMVLSVCNWGNQSPWNWAPEHVHDVAHQPGHHLLRRAGRSGPRPHQLRFGATPVGAEHRATTTIRTCSSSACRRSPLAQNRTHMALWAISGAPLLAGNNLMTHEQRHQERARPTAR